ncbi:uncharacterized protein LOC105434942 [Cucumis sativus]|uniref:uncharacterized protein LOC105434942 n=1 Tax=Cucumis sativus TaxID=3659 RepID=UPI0012F4A43D|nr:uncharacterized protein LOC105434942 [Cucumis sativus]
MESLPVMVATTTWGIQIISRRGINHPAHPMVMQLINKRNLVILELPKLPRFRQNPLNPVRYLFKHQLEKHPTPPVERVKTSWQNGSVLDRNEITLAWFVFEVY